MLVDQQPEAVLLMVSSLDTGGSERQFATIARALDPGAFQVRLGCLDRRGPLLEGLPAVAEFPLGGSFLAPHAWRSRRRLRGYLRSEGIRIAHSFDFYTNLTLIPAARRARVPVVIGSHRQLGDLLGPVQFGAQAAVFRLCDRVVCNSRSARNRLADQGVPEAKLVVIPNGLPEEAFADAAPLSPRNPLTPRVGMVARMNDARKNHISFLRAAAGLAPRYPQVEWWLIGDGPLRSGLERTAQQLGLSRRVRFLGDRRDMVNVLRALDISVVPSVSESLSNVILESMAAGLPVVAARVGGNPELVEPGVTGLLAAPDDDADLAEAIERLLARPELGAEMGRRARAVARGRFRLSEVAAQYERLYTTLLDQKTRSGRTLLAGARLRVAIVAPTLNWVGGQAVQADLLLRHWNQDREVEARFIPVDPEMPAALRWAQRIPYLRTFLRQPFYLAALWRGLKSADVAHVFSASYWSFILAPLPAWLVARALGKPVLINYRSGEAPDHLRRSRTAVRVLRSAACLVVPSAYLVEVFRKFGLKARVVPNIVDRSQFSFRAREPLEPRLLSTRGFEPYYGIEVVVKAFARVQQEFPEARLCLVGQGPLEGQIRALVEKLGLRGVEFRGAVSRREIGQYYSEAGIFINASWLDNMPVSILEAFAAGLPVASTAPEGIRYIVDHERTGLLSAVGDPEALAANVLRLLRNPAWARALARQAYEESRRYHWDSVRAEWLAVYRSLLRNGPAASAALDHPTADLPAQVGPPAQPGGAQTLKSYHRVSHPKTEECTNHV